MPPAIRNANNSAYPLNWSREFELIQIITQSTKQLRPQEAAEEELLYCDYTHYRDYR